MTHFMGQSGPLAKVRAAVRCGVRYTYRGAARALPEGKIIPVKWANSQFLWYK